MKSRVLALSLVLTACSSGGADRIGYAPPAVKSDVHPPGGEPVIAPPVMPPPVSTTAPKYCSLQTGPSFSMCPRLTSVGDATIDRLFWAEASVQQSFWGVATVVHITAGAECEGSGNAFATADGQVFFGKRLMLRQISQFSSMVPVHAILAHEFAHRLQFTFGWSRADRSPATSRLIELEADGWSGFYARWVKNYSSSDFATHLQTLYGIGDTDYNSPEHHGTAIERKYLGLYGWAMADVASQEPQPPTWAALHDQLVREIAAQRLAPDTELEAAGFDLSLLPPPASPSDLQRSIEALTR